MILVGAMSKLNAEAREQVKDTEGKEYPIVIEVKDFEDGTLVVGVGFRCCGRSCFHRRRQHLLIL